jgi:outer membrane protein assembly factor BamB
LAWTFSELGVGYSGPAVVGDRLYILGTKGELEHVFALDTNSGKIVWSTEVGPIFRFKGNTWGDGPRSTPTVDGDQLYALGGQGELLCLERASGRKVWAHNLYKDFKGAVMDNNGPERTGWGYAEGPLVDGDKVVVTPGGDEGLLVALDNKNGEVIWRSKEVKSKAPYSSIIAVEVGGARQYVQLTEMGLAGVDAKTGKLLWSYDRKNDDLVIRTPIFHDNCVFATYSFGAGSQLIQLVPEGSSIKVQLVYFNRNMKNEMGGVVLVGDHLYGYSDGKGWTCQEFKKNKGDIVWAVKRLGKGSLTCAGGQLYCYEEDEGNVVLAEANPKKWTENGRFKIPRETAHRPPSGKIWSHPVVANGRLYLRDQELLFCYDVRAGAS